VIASALNKAKGYGKTVNLRSGKFRGKDKAKQLYKVSLFQSEYYVLCAMNVFVTLFTEDMIQNDMQRGCLIFLEGEPFEKLKRFCTCR
jgi:hypothetical protein